MSAGDGNDIVLVFDRAGLVGSALLRHRDARDFQVKIYDRGEPQLCARSR